MYLQYNGVMSDKSTANKRTKDQIEADRELAIELYNRGYTQQEIADYISSTSEYSISRSQVKQDLNVVRKRWIESQIGTYQEMVNRELSRLDSFERELWSSWRDSKGTITKERVEKVARDIENEVGDVESDELVRLVVDRVVTTTEDSLGDTRLLELIFKTQQERRKLLGVYAPAKFDVDIRETLNIKTYSGDVSPNDWPDSPPKIVEGEFSDAG